VVTSGRCVANSPWHACGAESKLHACGWCKMIKEHTDTHAVRAESVTVLERTHKQTGRKKVHASTGGAHSRECHRKRAVDKRQLARTASSR
jgi:hypothetical protein